MALRYVVLHFGAHKTGTSLVQKYMRDKSKLCVANKVHALPRDLGTKLIGWGKPEDLKTGREELLGKIQQAEERGADYYVISHENSIGRPFFRKAQDLYPRRMRVRLLKADLRNNDLRVVYYIRSQANFLESYYLQTVHQGGTERFRQWRRQAEPKSLSWRPVYETLSKIFGREKVLLRSFDRDIAEGQAAYLRKFFESFMSVDPKAWVDFDYGPVRNPSVGDKGLAMALAVNGFCETGEERKKIRKFLQDNFSNLTYPRPALLTKKEKLTLSRQYDAENIALIAESEAAVSPIL